MIALIVPTLNRPHLLGPLAGNARDTLSVPYTLLFVVDHDDQESRRVILGLDNAKMLLAGGTYPQKTNRGVKATTEPLLLLANDDIVLHPGWFEAAAKAFEDERVCVIGPSDLAPSTQNGDNATMPIVRRSYLEDPGGAWGERGTAFHEGYHHNYSETELWQLAYVRGAAKFIAECVVEHRHPDWGTAPLDETYERGARQNFTEDWELFVERRAIWAPQ